MVTKRFKKKRFYRVVSDRQVYEACKLRGVDPTDGNEVIFKVIPDAFGGRLKSFRLQKSTLGNVYGRWEVFV